MKAIVKIEKEVELKTLVVKAGVRYYEDGMVGFTQFSPRNKFVVCGNIYENPELLNK